jgi:DNA-binding PadR family transcriptional regulator
MHELSAFQRDLLFVVAGLDGPNGREIGSEVAEYYGEEIQDARLYPGLDTLADKGLVEKREADGRTNSYRLSRRGRRELEARLAWEREHVGLEHGLEGEVGADR